MIAKGVSLNSVAMPAITLAIAMSAKYLRQVRAAVLDELSQDYVVGAKARGIRFSTTLWGSVMKASLVTIMTLSDAVGGKPPGRNRHCRIDLYVGWRGKDGGGCYQYERLSHHTGLCHVDGHHLCGSQSPDRYFLSISWIQGSVWEVIRHESGATGNCPYPESEEEPDPDEIDSYLQALGSSTTA